MNRTNPFSNLEPESKTVFDYIHKRGPMTKKELAAAAGVSLTTLNRMMLPLEERRLIVQTRIGASTGGRKPALFDIGRDAYYTVGVDISRTYTKVALIDLKMNIVAKREFLMDEEATPEHTVRQIGTFVREQADRLAATRASIIGVGVGTVGPLDRERGVILSPQLFPAAGWSNTPVVEMLERETGIPVQLEIGVNTAVVAEYYFGWGKDTANLAYVNCGIGIKLGMMIAGSIVRTVNDADDAFGHMIVNVDGAKCSCGNYGCIEAYTSIPSVVRAFTNELKKGRQSSVEEPPEAVNYARLCEAAEQGDPLAREVISNAAATLGTGLANFINLLNPSMVVLSGPLVKLSPLYYDIATSIARKRCNAMHESKVQFKRDGWFGGESIVVGAAAIVIERLLGNVL
ncbi:ROK family transcriptional regulator [Paenibacillus sp. IB182496]|uniref:ROK family transcriptional regulator n=1 Tax=Paenibacillus sabuli TaxID=2772509 RepID=A0A927BWI5_9BACL|nr:ROK family transcriptional regulator [Paenibacillus sabuli]MBD2846653.1 ROK family transcriptional regulator [Paenibacillus sabuli]